MIHVECLENILVFDLISTSKGQVSDVTCHYIFFSTVKTKFLNVYSLCRGKGDYHRLGHGSDDHVRRPRQVQGLQGKKVIAIATGSLHCVCCTEDGIKIK